MKYSRALDIIDWIGVVLILSAYTALSFGLIPANLWFQLPTLIGSLIVAGISWKRRDTQPAILNAAFASVALLAIIRIALLH